jgi:hypothetical protein
MGRNHFLTGVGSIAVWLICIEKVSPFNVLSLKNYFTSKCEGCYACLSSDERTTKTKDLVLNLKNNKAFLQPKITCRKQLLKQVF